MDDEILPSKIWDFTAGPKIPGLLRSTSRSKTFSPPSGEHHRQGIKVPSLPANGLGEEELRETFLTRKCETGRVHARGEQVQPCVGEE